MSQKNQILDVPAVQIGGHRSYGSKIIKPQHLLHEHLEKVKYMALIDQIGQICKIRNVWRNTGAVFCAKRRPKLVNPIKASTNVRSLGRFYLIGIFVIPVLASLGVDAKLCHLTRQIYNDVFPLSISAKR